MTAAGVRPVLKAFFSGWAPSPLINLFEPGDDPVYAAKFFAYQCLGGNPPKEDDVAALGYNAIAFGFSALEEFQSIRLDIALPVRNPRTLLVDSSL